MHYLRHPKTLSSFLQTLEFPMVEGPLWLQHPRLESISSLPKVSVLQALRQ